MGHKLGSLSGKIFTNLPRRFRKTNVKATTMHYPSVTGQTEGKYYWLIGLKPNVEWEVFVTYYFKRWGIIGTGYMEVKFDVFIDEGSNTRDVYLENEEVVSKHGC